MKLILMLVLLASIVSSQTIVLRDVAYAMTNSQYVAYAYQGYVDIQGGVPTDNQLAGYAMNAATIMRQQWRDGGWNAVHGEMGMPYTVSAFYTGSTRVYLHSSVKGTRRGTTALRNMVPGSVADNSNVNVNIAPRVQEALDTCGGAYKHANLANCAEVMVINQWAVNNPAQQLSTLTHKRISTAAISNLHGNTGTPWVMDPCNLQAVDGFGCQQFLAQLGVAVCPARARRKRAVAAGRLMRRAGEGAAAAKKKKAPAAAGGTAKQAPLKADQLPPRPAKKQTAAEIAALVAREDASCKAPSKTPGGAAPPFQCPAGQEPQLKKQAQSGKILPVLKKNKATGKMEPVCVKKGSQPTTGGPVKPAVAGKPAAKKPVAGKPAAEKPVAGKPAAGKLTKQAGV
ncbi:hypothetical protein DFH27DRAFT_579151 [Peziza echinospora]|nr:hypothetical protein DFH27DRAFT_579151 [Peziza echinospora]